MGSQNKKRRTLNKKQRQQSVRGSRRRRDAIAKKRGQRSRFGLLKRHGLLKRQGCARKNCSGKRKKIAVLKLNVFVQSTRKTNVRMQSIAFAPDMASTITT